jgi:hypothetical protein
LSNFAPNLPPCLKTISNSPGGISPNKKACLLSASSGCLLELPVGPFRVSGQQPDKGDRHSQDIGRFAYYHLPIDIKGFPPIGGDRRCSCVADRVVGDGQMATGLCLSHQDRMVGIRSDRCDHNRSCATYRGFPGHKGCGCQPGEEFEDGVGVRLTFFDSGSTGYDRPWFSRIGRI